MADEMCCRDQPDRLKFAAPLDTRDAGRIRDHAAALVRPRYRLSIAARDRSAIAPRLSAVDVVMRPRQVGFYSVVFATHGVDAVDAFEPADGEMTARHILKVLDEGEIDGRAAHCTDHRDSLRRHLLGYDDTEARGDLRQEADEEGSAFADRALVYGEVGNFDQPAGEHCANHEIVGLRARLVIGGATQREHFETGKPRPRISEVFPLLLSDGCDGAQHDRGRNRQLDRERGETESTADRPGGAGEPGMKLTAPDDAAILQTEQRNIEGTLEGVLRQLGDRRRRGCR